MKGHKKHMKKLVKSSLVIIASLGLFGCSNNSDKSNSAASTTPTSTTPTSTKPSDSSTKPSDTKPVTHTLTFVVEGTKKVGETLTVSNVNFDGAGLTPTELANVTVTVSDTTAFEINGRKLKCLKAGDYTVTVTYSGTTATEDVTVEEGITYSTVAEVRALAVNNEYKPVYVKGVITATSGTSAFLQDSTGGIFIYNFYFQDTDTACSNYVWQLGTTVEIHSYVTAYYGAPQLTYSYKDTTTNKYVDLDGRFANLSEDTMTAPDPIEIGETELKALTVADTGKMYKFVATYQSGEIETTKKSTLNFKVGDTSVKFATDGSSSKAFDKKISDIKSQFEALGLEAGDEVEITAPLYSYSTSANTFSYFGFGSSITKHFEKDTLYTKYSGELKVGQKLTFSSSYNGNAVEATYAATKGADLVTISGNEVTLNAVGDVTITATYMDGETEKTDTVDFTIASADPVAINTIVAGSSYFVKGLVTGVSNKGFVVTDATGSIYVHVNDAPTVVVGDVVTVDGEVSNSYHGMVQFSTPEVTKLTETTTVTDPEAIELTTTIADGFVRTTNTVTDVKKYKWTSTVTKDGTFDLLNLDGSNTKIEPSYYKGTLTAGNTYEFEGFFISYDTTYKYASMLLTKVTEKAPTEVSVSLDKTAESIEVGGTVTLTADVKLPENVTDKSVTWASSDTAVATVADGVVTGVAVGTTEITATSVADTTKSAKCTITVTEKVEGTVITVDFDADFNKDFTTIEKTKVVKTTQDVTFTIDKAKSTTDIAINTPTDETESPTLKYINPLRVYKSSTLTLSSTKYNFVKIEFTCTASGTAKYGPGCFTADSNYTYEDKVGTWANASGASSVTFTASTNQVQIKSVKLTVLESAVSD